ncbi:peptide chain release factor H [Pseudofulvibacter geojedonensis]|uniref:Peptide chain release factor H n=1 Tax=Pseudofulvibacter geojedonensis TaxID=1123758 RepID=A0ABW3I098_9FLAO
METKTIQISAGRGPLECCWVVAQVLKFFLEEVKNNQIEYTILNKQNGMENGTVQSVTLSLTSHSLDLFLSQWIGTIQWIGKSQFRKYHKRKNWFIGIYELQQVRSQKIAMQDIYYQTMRSQGKGGQHANKVNTAVRAIHKPTGLAVVSMDSRSQTQNKKLATERLIVKLKDQQINELAKQATEDWTQHLNIERGNPVKTFNGTDFKKQLKKKTFKSKRNELKKQLNNSIKNL